MNKPYSTDQMYVPRWSYSMIRRALEYAKGEQPDLYEMFMERRRQEKMRRRIKYAKQPYHYDCADLDDGLVKRIREAGL